jgi:hypothetical protein
METVSGVAGSALLYPGAKSNNPLCIWNEAEVRLQTTWSWVRILILPFSTTHLSHDCLPPTWGKGIVPLLVCRHCWAVDRVPKGPAQCSLPESQMDSVAGLALLTWQRTSLSFSPGTPRGP